MLVDSTNVKNGKTVNGRKAIGEFNSTKGEIVLDIGEGNVAATSLHESVHYIRINAPEEFNAMAKYVVEWLTRNGTLEEYLDRYASSYKLDNIYDLTEEMTADIAEALLKNADFVEDLFTDEAFIKEICGENRTFAEKFVDALKSIIEAIKNYLKSGDVNHLIAGKLSEDAKALEEIKNLWEDGLKAAVDNHAKSSAVKQDTKKSADKSGNKFALEENETKYDYNSLIAKDDIMIATDINVTVPRIDGRINRKEVIKQSLNNINPNNENRFIYNKDLGKYVKITRKGIEHGLTRKGENNALAAMLIKSYLPNAICVNELNARDNLTNSYILLGVFQNNNKFYCVRIIVNENENAYAVKDIDVLYALNAKEIEPAATKRRGLGVETDSASTGSKISIADFLDDVKNYYSDVLSDSVISRLQTSRKDSSLSSSIKFSLSEPVEEKDNLIAVHNIYTDKLVKSLKLGGFPMPSIAVTKADMGHGNYGECSFVFDKSTIDPKADKRNKVYGGDAWTPTYPAIEYKASEDVIQRVKDTREHNLFGKDGTFMHCSGGAFLLPKTRLKLRGEVGGKG